MKLNGYLQQMAAAALATGDFEAAERFASYLTESERVEMLEIAMPEVWGKQVRELRVVAAVAVDSVAGIVGVVFSRRGDDEAKATALVSRDGRRVPLTAEQSERVWLERGKGITFDSLDAAQARVGDRLCTLPSGAISFGDVRARNVLAVVTEAEELTAADVIVDTVGEVIAA